MTTTKKIYGAHHMSNRVNKFFFVKEINLMKASCHSSTFPTIFFYDKRKPVYEYFCIINR